MIVERDNDQDFTRAQTRVRDADHPEDRAFDFAHDPNHTPDRDTDPDRGLLKVRRELAPDHT